MLTSVSLPAIVQRPAECNDHSPAKGVPLLHQLLKIPGQFRQGGGTAGGIARSENPGVMMVAHNNG